MYEKVLFNYRILIKKTDIQMPFKHFPRCNPKYSFVLNTTGTSETCYIRNQFTTKLLLWYQTK